MVQANCPNIESCPSSCIVFPEVANGCLACSCATANRFFGMYNIVFCIYNNLVVFIGRNLFLPYIAYVYVHKQRIFNHNIYTKNIQRIHNIQRISEQCMDYGDCCGSNNCINSIKIHQIKLMNRFCNHQTISPVNLPHWKLVFGTLHSVIPMFNIFLWFFKGLPANHVYIPKC